MAQSNKEQHALTDAQRRKSELIAELARARSGMTLHAGQVSYQADVGRKVKSSFRQHIGAWLAGALVTGGFISMLPARERKVYVNPLMKGAKEKVERSVKQAEKKGGGFFMSLFRALMPILRPVLTALATKHLGNLLGGGKEQEAANAA